MALCYSDSWLFFQQAGPGSNVRAGFFVGRRSGGGKRDENKTRRECSRIRWLAEGDESKGEKNREGVQKGLDRRRGWHKMGAR
jgi:hypothetical protein